MSTAPDGIQVKKVLTETGTGPTRIIRAWETFIFSVSYLVLLGLSTTESTFQKFGIPYKRWKTPKVKKYPCNIIREPDRKEKLSDY